MSSIEAAELRGSIESFCRTTGMGTAEIARVAGLTWEAVYYIRKRKSRRPLRTNHERITTFMRDELAKHARGGRETVERADNGAPLAHTDATARCAAPEHFVMTRAANVVHNALDYCARRRINGAVFGDPGVGKSEAMRHWSATTKHEHAVVFCRATTTYVSFMRAVARAIALDGPVTADELDESIHEEMSARPRLLVIDEADMLTARTLDWLRTIWDESGHRASFCLLAKPAFYQRLQVEHARSRKHDLRQVWRRINFRKIISGISREEVLEYAVKRGLHGKLDEGAADALHQACGGSFGDLDMLLELIGQMLDENPKLGGRITPALAVKAREVRFGADIVGRRR